MSHSFLFLPFMLQAQLKIHLCAQWGTLRNCIVSRQPCRVQGQQCSKSLEQRRVRVKALPRTECEHPFHSFHLLIVTGPRFPHPHSGDSNGTYFCRLLQGLNELVCVQCLEQCLELEKCSINVRYYFHFQKQAALIEAYEISIEVRWEQ